MGKHGIGAIVGLIGLCLENNGKIDLVMIEVQVGEYTGEDDIVRIEDVYGR